MAKNKYNCNHPNNVKCVCITCFNNEFNYNTNTCLCEKYEYNDCVMNDELECPKYKEDWIRIIKYGKSM